MEYESMNEAQLIYESLPLNGFSDDYPLVPGRWHIGFYNIETKICHYEGYLINKTIRVKDLNKQGYEIKTLMRIQ